MDRKYIKPKLGIYSTKDLLEVLGPVQNQYTLTFDVYRMSMYEERIECPKETKALAYLLDGKRTKDEKDKYMV